MQKKCRKNGIIDVKWINTISCCDKNSTIHYVKNTQDRKVAYKYKTLYVTIMEPRKTLTSRVMKRPSIRNKLSMKVVHLNIEPKRWGNNANKVTPTNM